MNHPVYQNTLQNKTRAKQFVKFVGNILILITCKLLQKHNI